VEKTALREGAGADLIWALPTKAMAGLNRSPSSRNDRAFITKTGSAHGRIREWIAASGG